MGDNLTKRQRQILDFINEFSEKNGYSPSYREIGEHFNLSSTATIHAHVSALEKKGLVKRSHNEARSIELVNTTIDWPQAVELPLAGLITAGEPIEAVETHDTIAVPADLVTDNVNSYVLKVQGESMIDEGILSGDYVIIERNPSPKNGDIVVALLDNAFATLKKFFREKDFIRLQPANSSMEPIFVKDLAIQGVVKGVIRKF
ncbi:repressor LexA [Candidatus Parcubacteria bacterium]|nr:MAG: repressor LexA [Candidatus Parcubacteria bacterium]